ncbi:related to cell wall glycoprotein [Fusarium fujikuroi IMI 58289]|uniref:Related to cell wall glycoprotein n=1 Tax=Gibberella fujikuroi (strain CBS 195.34 / IMI 58289 / NRRL A-6831) TaxID=1279085 RepID=S0EFU4_GIBF5|nr:related to cell wall glycoprotein [Fusarium fujikuroi IMI 58289]CCT72722.1 related to cell wall glycoprotein [Fusarium fujikuroi IMI 58289]
MGFIKSASIASVLIGAATASPHYAPPSNETVKYTTEVVTHLTTYCPEATTLTYGEKTYTITEATTLTIEDCSCTITKPVATGTGYAAPPKPTHAKDCAEMCSDKYDDCRVAPNANMATCAAEYAACLNYNPWESGKFVKPTSCHAGGKPTAVYTTEVVTAVTTYCPEATTLTYGNKTIPVTAPGTVTVPDCHFTTTKPIGCAEKCSDAYNKCRTGADANMSYCAATYAECLGYSPFNGEGSLVTPTACSVAPVATKPATAPAYNPPAGTKPAGAPPATTPTHVVTAGAAQVVPAGIIAVVGALAML